MFQVSPISVVSIPNFTRNINPPSSPTGFTTGPKGIILSQKPIASLGPGMAATTSASASTTSQLSPCSTKENCALTDKVSKITTQQICFNITQAKVIHKTNDNPIQLSTRPVQFHPTNITSLRYPATLPIKRKRRNTRKGNKIAECNQSVIARYKKLGEGALSKLKNEVRAYAVDHTYKQTARKFGIHHSTVSGWIKRFSTRQQQINSRRITAISPRKEGISSENSCYGVGHIQMNTAKQNDISITSNCNCSSSNKGEKVCEPNCCVKKVNL